MRILILLLTGFLTAGCSHSTGDLTILSASSLTHVLPELSEVFASQFGLEPVLVFGGSNHLAAQLNDGASADVFLTADLDLIPAGSTGSRFAGNYLVIATQASNPANVNGPQDLAKKNLRIAICATGVPCGDATKRLNVPLAPDTEEPSVQAVISRLLLGDADVGVIYATDAANQPAVEAIWPETPACPCVEYTAVALTEIGNSFTSFLDTPVARTILREHGFPQ